MPEPRNVHGRVHLPQTQAQRRSLLQVPHQQFIDQDDPHRAAIAIMLHRMELAGVEIDERAAEIATKLVHWEIAQREGRDAESIRERAEKQAAWRNPEPHFRLDPGIVYYILKQRLIKIGVTSRPIQRFKVLIPDAILAVEPGDEDLERRRHGQFRELRAGARGEYFLPAPILVDHIRALREEHGAPQYPFRSLISQEESATLVAELLDTGTG